VLLPLRVLPTVVSLPDCGVSAGRTRIELETGQEVSDTRRLDISQYFSPTRLRLLILPTEKCNFRCSYCYEDFALGRMTPDVMDGIISLVKSRKDTLDQLDIDWFGGEPLLARDIIFNIAKTLMEVCELNHIGYRSTITTNGYFLNESVTSELLRYGISNFQVSLDGPQEVHNAQRPTASGQPTFSVIANNIGCLLSTDQKFKLVLRVHFQPKTVDAVKRFVVSQLREWTEDPRVEVLFAHVENLASDSRVHVEQMDQQELSKVISYFRSLLPAVRNKQDDRYVCYAAQPNAFVIRADGRVGKCTVALSDPRNTIGTLTSDGKLLVDNEKARTWMLGWLSGKPDALACPLSALDSEHFKILSNSVI
jgi:uncharacterized protein